MAQEESISRIRYSILNSSKKPAFIPFIVSGFPDLGTTKDLLKFFDKQGAAAVEVGFPYSDPLADGPVIQKASKLSLEAGVNSDKIFNILDELKDDISIPVIVFTYFNPVLKYGKEKFIQKASLVNAAGIIIPDLPLEESDHILNLCGEYNIELIMLISPTSGKQRVLSKEYSQ